MHLPIALARCLLLAVFLFNQPSVAATAPTGIRPVTTVEGVTEYLHENGLRILLAPDNTKPVITANMVYLVGSRHEGPGEGGMAHLLEHLVFKGTPTTPDPKAQFVQRGMQWNGTTSYDRTNYFATFNAEGDSLDWYIGWLADSMVNSFISRRDLDTEMTVVRNEFERAGVRPDVVLYQSLLAAAYAWHPYGKAVIGNRADIENVAIDSLQAFYRRYYQPDNAVLVVAGKFDSDAVLQRVAAAFGKLPKPDRVLKRPYTEEPVQQGERNVVLRRTGNSPMIAVAYHGVPAGSKEYAAQIVLRQILTGTPSGRLYKALVEGGYATTLSDWTPVTQDPGFLYVSALLSEGADADKAQQILLDAIEAMPPVTEDEVNRAKTLVLNAVNRTLLDAQSLAMSMTDSIVAGDWRLRFAMRDWIAAVTPADVERQARNYLVQSNRSFGRFIPTAQPARAPRTTQADTAALLKDYQGRTAAAFVEAFPMTNTEIQSRTVTAALPVGMKLAMLPRATKGERVTATLRLHWGSLESLQGKRADALLLPQMMLKGTATLSRVELNNLLSELDSTITINGLSAASGGVTGLVAELTAPKANLVRVMQLLADVLRRPEFPATEFEQARRAFIAQAQAVQNDPAALASATLAHHLVRYSADDPRCVQLPAESQQTAKEATLERTRAFYRAFAGASNAEFAIVGPIEPQAVIDQMRSLFDDWRSPQAYARLPRPMQETPMERAILHMPEKTNAAYAAAVPVALNDNDEDAPALYTAVQLLGGRAGTRLWNRLREKEGLSYGVQSNTNLLTRDRNGRINISGSFAPQNRERFESALRDELEKVLQDGFSALEVDFAKEATMRSRRQFLTQERNVANLLADNLYWDRTMEVRERRDEAYAKLGADDVNAALKKYLLVDKLSAVVAGDFPRH